LPEKNYFYKNFLLKKIPNIYLALLSGLLLFAAWPVLPLTFLVFVAWVPLLVLETRVKKRAHFFWLTYLTLLLWNAASTWWVLNSTVIGGILAVLLNPLLMCIPWIGFYNMKKRFGPRVGYISLVLFWLSFEYIHLNWELSWPWLTLGNVFAMHPGWVQWYEYTGVSGGTLWILMINLGIFQLIHGRASEKNAGSPRPFSSPHLIWILADLILPFLFSWLIIHAPDGQTGKSPAMNIVIVQPNIDPWDEKFVAGKEEAQLQKLISLSESEIDSDTRLVVWPETAVPVAVNEDSMKTSYFIAPVWDFLKKHPQLNLVTGIEGFRVYDRAHRSATAEPIPHTDKYYDAYNSAVLMDSSRFQAYHKSKLVPGAETLPYFLKFMAGWFEEFGGTGGSYVKQDERTVLNTFNQSYRIAPSVCYESIYGEFMSKYVHRGANLICIITNDGWWRNTSGYKQHENYARLLAIQTRCWIARSANTGVSCFISPDGRLIDAQPYNTVASIKWKVPPAQSSETFFVSHGDIISKVAMTIALLLVIWDLLTITRNYIRRG
jgi:apolipoprotein N-acyltransferase